MILANWSELSLNYFPLQKRKPPLNQPENCLVLLGWNVAVTTRPDGTAFPEKETKSEEWVSQKCLRELSL